MRRICLSLLILLACGNVGAREVKLSSPDGGSCPTEPVPPLRVETRKPAATPRAAAPTPESRVRPSVHGDLGTTPRARWHSFLPGMFR